MFHVPQKTTNYPIGLCFLVCLSL